MEYQKIKGSKHYVFNSKKEYIDHFTGAPPTLHEDWRKAEQGDWVVADDGGIVQLLKVSNNITHPNDRKNYNYAKGWVRTVVGTFLNRETSKMDSDFSKHKNRYTFSRTIKNPSKRVRKRTVCTKKERLFATNMAVGSGVVRAYKDAFGGEVEDGIARRKGMILLKQDRVMKEVEKSVLDVAKKMGIDHEYILNNLKQLCEYSEDENIQLQATKELGKAVGTLGAPKIQQREVGIYGMLQEFSTAELEKAKRPELEVAPDDMPALQ